MKRTYVQNPVTGKFEEKRARPRLEMHYVQDDVQPFVSPVDGSIISSKSGLRNHNARNDVVNYQEFGDAHFERKAAERAKFYDGSYDRKGRTEDIVRAVNAEEDKRRRNGR